MSDAEEVPTAHALRAGADESGQKVAAGVYLYRLRAGDFVATRRMVVIR